MVVRDLWANEEPRPNGSRPATPRPAFDAVAASSDEGALKVLAPARWLAAAAASLAVGALMLMGTTAAIHLAGWGSASVFTVLFVAVFRMRDAGAQTSPLYSPANWPGRVAGLLLIGGLVLAVIHAWYFASLMSS